MRFAPLGIVALPIALSLGAPATAQSAPLGFAGRTVTDPDEGLERLAAASTRAPRNSGHDRPNHRASLRDVLRDDHAATRDAYAWLDNR